MAGSNASKGNPAGKRMMNAHLKEKRAASWARGQKVKPLRVKANAAAHAANRAALDAVDIAAVPAGRKSGVKYVQVKGKDKPVPVYTNWGNGNPDRDSVLKRRRNRVLAGISK